jgi:Fe-Mn family superoxide dismutase
MAIQVIPLPYNINALEPVISAEALRVHFDEHYRNYVNKSNELISDTIYEDMPIREIVLKSGKKIQWDHEIKIFNNVNQAWNHTFFWNCLTPAKNMIASDHLKKRLIENFGSYEAFVEQFEVKASELFGSGWCWLVVDSDLNLEIMLTKNGENPLTSGKIPIFVVDLWEHAYYLDYQSSRQEFVDNIWSAVNWSFVEAELFKAEREQIKLRKSRETIKSLPTYFRERWIGIGATFMRRRKTSIKGGTLIGAALGAVIFFFISMLISAEVIPLPGLAVPASNLGSGLIWMFGIVFGAAVGAGCGALVGIGTPMSLHTHQKDNPQPST